MNVYLNLVSTLATVLMCTAREDKGHEALELLDIQPEFLDTPKNYNVEVGRTAVLECAIRNLMDRKVTWIKLSEDTPLTVGKETFQNTNRIFIEHEDNSPYWNLVISQVQLNDSGVYECQISSQYRHLRLHVLLTVVAAPATTTTSAVENSIQIYGSKFVEKERAILLTCNATGQEYVPEQLDWFFNGNKIVNDDPPGRVSIKTNNSIQMKSISSTLRIRGAQMDDAGLYLCRTSLQIESFSVVVVNADTHNVKRGTFSGKSDQWNGDDADEDEPDNRSIAHALVLHRHLLTSVLLLLVLIHYFVLTN